VDTGSYRFEIGEFECVSVSDGALNYPPESFFANVPLERVEEALHKRNLPTAQIMTPYSCLFIDTGEHRVMVDTGAESWEHTRQTFSLASITRHQSRACFPRT
jgi:hypothetical protein